MNILAEFLNENGYDYQPKECVELNMYKGCRYLVKDIQIGQSSSTVELHNFKKSFNTVMFKFLDADDWDFDKQDLKEIDIFKTDYNPYKRIKK